MHFFTVATKAITPYVVAELTDEPLDGGLELAGNLLGDTVLSEEQLEQQFPEALEAWRRGDQTAYIRDEVTRLAADSLAVVDWLSALRHAANIVMQHDAVEAMPLYRALVRALPTLAELEREIGEEVQLRLQRGITHEQIAAETARMVREAQDRAKVPALAGLPTEGAE